MDEPHQPIFDAHLDMAWNATDWNRNLDLPVAEIREFERQFDLPGLIDGDCMVSWPELRRGRVCTIIATLLARLNRRDAARTYYQSLEAAYGAAQGQLAYYRALVKRGALRQICDADALRTHTHAWQADDAAITQPLGFILSMEGSWPILSPEDIQEWWDAGLRILGPAHYGPNPYCHGTGTEGGWKKDGPALLAEMQRVGMILDVTHLSDECLDAALDLYGGPVLASHHNCRSLVPGQRQLTDENIRALVQRDAVIGASFDNWMIKPDWHSNPDPTTVTLDDIVNHTDHICQLAGDALHCGIGSDLDGGFGKEQSPSDLDTIADLHRFGSALTRRGYSAQDVENIMYGNWARFFENALPQA